MARYDIYAHPDATEREHIPFLLAIQNSYLDLIETTVVIPLCVADSLPTSVPDLNPSLTVLGQGVVLNTAALGPVPNSVLRHPLGNLSADKNSIQTALDTLFGGY